MITLSETRKYVVKGKVSFLLWKFIFDKALKLANTAIKPLINKKILKPKHPKPRHNDISI